MFLNRMHLSWQDYLRPHPKTPKKKTKTKLYYWQVHHSNGNPAETLADALKIVSYRTNEKERERAQKHMHIVFVRRVP